MTRGSPRAAAQRPFPSMITATWFGSREGSSSGGPMGRATGSVLVAGSRLKTALLRMSPPPYVVLVAGHLSC